ncbi:MAG TPA: heavy-metal-associated domain-containing protein [Bacteroidia bacterium]|nr:heavy-metal-associated domain-containing protein [Bacteroidia bacterium]HNP99800.1 heavy-metal-associated domain-containing protein [Bacteroidia bacterium]
MKTIKKLMLLAFFLITTNTLMAQTDTIRIHTSSLCDMCKKTIEHDLSFEKGVKSVHLDIDAKLVTVTYTVSKTTPDKIRIALTKIGYDADSLKADPKAFDKLPDCCKAPEGHH